jgi:hypothetical protein
MNVETLWLPPNATHHNPARGQQATRSPRAWGVVMAETFLFQRTLHGLQPDLCNPDALEGLPIGSIVSATIKRPRNVKHLRKLFALVAVIFPHQSTWLNTEDLRENLLIAAGHCEAVKAMVTDPSTGKKVLGEVWRAKSISFKALDQKGFEAVYERVVLIILEKILKALVINMVKMSLERQINGTDF